MKTDISTVGTSHYICNNPDCRDYSGNKTQFYLVEDEKVYFPYNQIFVDRAKSEFYQLPYIQLQPTGITELAK